MTGETFSGNELMTLQHQHIVKTVDMSEDGEWVITGTQDKKLRLFQLSQPEEPTLFGEGELAHSGFIRSVILDMKRKQILSVDDKEMKSVHVLIRNQA